MIFKVARLLGLICCLRLVLTLNLSCYEISFLKITVRGFGACKWKNAVARFPHSLIGMDYSI